MQQFSDLTRTWSDTLTTLSVGSLAFFLPYVGKIDLDGSLSFAFGEIADFFTFAENSGTFASIILSIMFLSMLMAIGYFVIQCGELISLMPDLKDAGQRAKTRAEKSSENSVLMLMFSNAYTAYRLFCGIGALFLLEGAALLFHGLYDINWQTVLSAIFIILVGTMILFRFARYSFAAIDWVIFGKVQE